MEHPYLSAVIIAFNEERNIGRCLDSLAGIADEVIVVDSGSTDATMALCEERGAQVVVHPFEGHVEQKNWAWRQTKGSWILSLDADESLSEELKEALTAWKADSNPKHLAYGFNRLTSYCGQWVRHSGWYPDRKLRLWKRDEAAWEGENPHDRLALIRPNSAGHLGGDLLHHSYHAPEDHLRQIAYFSDIAAQAYSGGAWASWPAIRSLKALFQWVKTGLLKGGWRDGKTGWTIARMSAFATLMKYRKVHRVLRHRQLLRKAGRTKVQRLLIARTDAIGDLVLTVPLAGWLKQSAPEIEVTFLVRSYAAPVAQCAAAVDEVLIWNPNQPPALTGFDAVILAFPDPAVARAARQANIPIRIGTGRRWAVYPLLTHRVWQSRKRSGRHETWHGLQLLHRLHLAPGWFKPGLAVPEDPHSWSEGCSWNLPSWDVVQQGIPGASDWLHPLKRSVIFHPGSRGSANNWSLARYEEAATWFLDHGCRVLLTGTAEEAKAMDSFRAVDHPEFVDVTGCLELKELMSLIQSAGGLLASSTGPLHLAASLDTPCVGLYGHEAPAWPERWHPVGTKTRWLVAKKEDASGGLDIPIEDVWEAFESLWGAPTPD
jgi:ADP-heptose:LPS heptosyltransferase/glycosyltransferase involved in cell wall biosynthesis